MNPTIMLLLLLIPALLSGLYVWWQWRDADRPVEEIRAYAHAASAALILLSLLLSLDNQAAGDAPRLLGIFLCIATGMLMFLQRQRLQKRSRALFWTHLGCTGLVLLGLGWTHV